MIIMIIFAEEPIFWHVAFAVTDVEAAMAGGAEMITQAGFFLDYFEARHAETLAPIKSAKDGPVRILVAAKIGRTRLIDNVAV